MAFQLATNLNLGAQLPLDARSVVANQTERNALAASGKAHAGLMVYVTGENKYYYYNTGNQWVDFGSSQNLTPTLYLRTSAKDTNGNNAGGIVSAISEDGIKWNSLSRNVTFPAFARDASTIWYNNQWVSVYTNAFTSTGKNFGIATSANLTSWVTGAPVSLTGAATTGIANNVWAPEWFIDNNEYYVLVRLSTTSGINYGPPGMGYVKSLNPGTWTSWGPWTPFDNTIRTDANDFYIVKKENLYWLFSHGGTHLNGQQPTGLGIINNITLQYSTNPFSGYSNLVEITEPLRNIIRPGNGSAFFEGPSVVNIQGSHWRLYFQDGLDNSVWSIDSFDDFQSWPTGSLRKNIYEGFDGGGHGTVLKINEKNFVGITQSLLNINSPLSIGAVALTGNQNISGNKTFNNNITILGDFSVSGRTVVTEVIDVTTTGAISGNIGIFDNLLSNNIVYNTGNQTISGNKTFVQTAVFSGTSTPLTITNTDGNKTINFGNGGDVSDLGTKILIQSGFSGLASMYRGGVAPFPYGFGIVFGGGTANSKKGYLTIGATPTPTGLNHASLVWTDRILSGQWEASAPIRVGDSISVMTTGNQTISGTKFFNDILISKKTIGEFSTDLTNYRLPLYRDRTLSFNTNFDFTFPTDDPNLQSILYVLRQPSGFGWGVNYNSIIWQNNNPGNPTLDKPRIFLIYRANETGTTAYGINLTEVASISQTVATTGNQTINGVKNFVSRLTVNATGVVLSGEAVQSNGTITRMIRLTQAQYNALSPKDPTTFYVIVG